MIQYEFIEKSFHTQGFRWWQNHTSTTIYLSSAGGMCVNGWLSTSIGEWCQHNDNQPVRIVSNKLALPKTIWLQQHLKIIINLCKFRSSSLIEMLF